MNGEESFEDIVAELKVEKAMMEDAGIYQTDNQAQPEPEPDGDEEPTPAKKPSKPAA